MDHENPFAPPESAQPFANQENYEAGEAPLAGRWIRLVAAIIDTLLLMVIWFPLMMVLGLYSYSSPEMSVGETVIGASISILIFLAINGYLLATSGQTVGKRIMSIQIVDYDTGQVPPFNRVYGMRYLVLSLITSIPLLGGIFAIVDVLFIFGEERRCLHDLMARTEVVELV